MSRREGRGRKERTETESPDYASPPIPPGRPRPHPHPLQPQPKLHHRMFPIIQLHLATPLWRVPNQLAEPDPLVADVVVAAELVLVEDRQLYPEGRLVVPSFLLKEMTTKRTICLDKVGLCEIAVMSLEDRRVLGRTWFRVELEACRT